MSPTTLLGRAARLHVTPTPTTLSDSLCILKRLQSFGVIETFLNPRYTPIPQPTKRTERSNKETTTFLAIFESPDTLSAAVSAGPLTIETGLDIPDPCDEDPYNVRGLRDRIPVPKKKFTCAVHPDSYPETRHATLLKQKPHHGSFTLDRQSLVVTDVLKSGAPVEGLASIPLSFPQSAHATPALQIRKTTQVLASQSLKALYTEVMASWTERSIFDEAQREQMRLAAKQRRTETNRSRRHEWKENQDRQRRWVQARQVQMDVELREELQEIFGSDGNMKESAPDQETKDG